MSEQNRFLHNVFFSLNDASPAKQQLLVDDCYRYLESAPGILSFSAGKRRADSKRNVNDLDFEVCLSILFDSASSHEAYQAWERHTAFIEANNTNWKQVRVFDSEVE
ncbi:MAG TPA: Dabb family protein [Spirochaetia bacterium]|nr:Dabb family protein [Spirochaetia bacterium]